MDDSFTRPYVNANGKAIYLTDQQAAERAKHGSFIRRLRPGEVVTPEVEAVNSIAPDPVTNWSGLGKPGVPWATSEAADTVVGDTVAHPVPEVREREVP